MRKELFGAVVMFGLASGGAWAQDGTAPTVQPTTAALAAAPDSGGAIAADTTATMAPAASDAAPDAAAGGKAVATTTQDGETVQEVASDHVLGSDLIGADVVQADGTSVGEISDLVIESDSHVIKNVVIDVGGFLGIGTRTVTLPVDDLAGPNQDGALEVAMTREQIEALPDFIGKPEPEQVPTMSDPASDAVAQ